MTQNKKRKQSPIYSDQQHHDDHDGKMVDDQENIESVLFDEMTEVNSKLISLGNNFKLVDNLYFVGNSRMVDEFIGNMQQFMKQLELHRNKVAFSNNINSDILSHVYQFLDTKTLINCCGFVSKLWKESLIGLKVEVRSKNIANFLDSSLMNHVTELQLSEVYKNASPFRSLSNCSNLNQLKTLDLSNNKLDSECIEYLMKCNMPNLTELNLKRINIIEKDAIELLNSTFMSTITKLDLSSTAIENFTNNFYETISESKYLNQITHLKICNIQCTTLRRVDLLLKDKVNLERLKLCHYDFTLCANLLINGTYKNLKHLDVEYCKIKNQEFVNLLVSPNLPNLETFQAKYSLDESDKTIAIFPPNSQSSITDLNFKEFKPSLFPSLFDHCPKLKKLNATPIEVDKEFVQMMKSPCLSNLEFLDITLSCEIVEEIFMNPNYSNLKELSLVDVNIYNVKFISNCANLVNLTLLDLSECYVKDISLIEECSKALMNNPTFSKLKHIELPEYDLDEDTD